MKRRELLVGAALGVGAAAVARTGLQASERPQEGGDDATDAPFDPSSWESVRAQFALRPGVVHLAAMYIATHPAPVRAAIERYRAALDGDPARTVLDEGSDRRRDVVREAARFFGAPEEGVALTDSTTMGLSVLYQGLRLQPGDEVIVEDPSYYSTLINLMERTERTGIVVHEVRIYQQPEAADPTIIRDALLARVTPRTRLLALTWVHSDTGLKLPIRDIADAVADLNRRRPEPERILVCVDGVHGFGVHDTTIGALGCDFFVAGGHKWVFGPRGTGVVYAANEALWSRVGAIIPPFGLKSTPGLMRTPGGFHSFEHRWALADAFRFLRQIGLVRVEARTRELATALKAKLRSLDRVRVLTPESPDLSAGIVAFTVAGKEPVAVAKALRARDVVVSASAWGVPSIRATPSLLNTEADLDRLVEALREVL